MLKIQEYLRAGNTFEQLEAQYGIAAKQHSQFPNLFQFKYSQVESDPAEPIVQECRGIILDADNDYAVVAMPFKRFFNLNEPNAAKIDWSSIKVQEKLDGSLVVLYHYGNKWNVATSGCPDGTNRIGDYADTFEELFWHCFSKQGIQLNRMDPTYTYMWEVTSPLNRIVCDYRDSKITLIGVRNNVTLEEISVSRFNGELPTVKEYSFKTAEECLEAASKLNPLENEGYVVVDQFWNRVKIKSVQWIALHHVISGCSYAKLADIIRNGEYQEFLISIDSYPDVKKRFITMQQRYEDRVKDCISLYERINDAQSQKEFAERVLRYDSAYSSILFKMRKTGKSPKEIIKNMTRNAYLRLLGVEDDI